VDTGVTGKRGPASSPRHAGAQPPTPVVGTSLPAAARAHHHPEPLEHTMSIDYAFHNSSLADQQLTYLQQILDPISHRRLLDAGLRPGMRCLEIGAGAGSIAAWLTDMTGPGGRVLATDLEPDRINAPCDKLLHNIVDDPVPDGPWDLIHARLVLLHLPQREDVLAKLAGALADGGVLVLEDFDCRLPPPAVSHPNGEDAGVWWRVVSTVLRTLSDHGADLGWGARTFAAMRAAGLRDVIAEHTTRTWNGATAGCLLHAVNIAQLRATHGDELTSELAPGDLDRFDQLVHDPGFAAQFYTMISTTGWRR
jgi:SAM-dependent methyltransferase